MNRVGTHPWLQPLCLALLVLVAGGLRIWLAAGALGDVPLILGPDGGAWRAQCALPVQAQQD